MADDGSGEKTEEPTPKKLEDARKKGQVWKSRDLTGAAVFLAGFFVMAVLFPTMLAQFRGLVAAAFARVPAAAITADDVAEATYRGLQAILLLTVPVALAGAAAGALADFLQVGALFSLEPLQPKLEKLNPLQGLKNLFSKKQLVELLKAAFKMLLAGYVAFGVVRSELRMLVATARAGPDLLLAAGGRLIYRLTTRVGLLLVLFAIFDVWWQRKVFMKDLRMTKDEVKREYKESEGDPHHKARRKEMHQEILESSQLQDVATADVVVTNPEHYAVGLRYRRERDGAPRVIAKGLDARALQIQQIAREAGVAVLRNVPLAHALYRVDLGEEIPEPLYDAVAEVLDFVYAEQRRREGLA